MGDGGGAAVTGVLYCIHGPIRGRDDGEPGGNGLGVHGFFRSGVELGRVASWKWQHQAAGVGYAKLAAAKLSECFA